MGIKFCKLRRNSTSNQGNWNDLPEEILTSIFILLPSIADLACAASVSHPWNVAASVASNNQSALHQPPLILTTVRPKKSFKIDWGAKPRCYLIPLESRPTSKPYYRSSLSSQTLAKPFCKGHNFSKFILVDGAFIILHDVFSGEQIRSPEFASLRDLHIDFATLTASSHSSSLSLVLVVAHVPQSPNYCVFSWEPNGSGSRDEKCIVDMEIVSFASVKDQVYFVDMKRRVGVVEFEPIMSCNLLGDISMEKLPLPIYEVCDFRKTKLVDCDGELLIVRFIYTMYFLFNFSIKIKAYKLDLEKWRWVKMEKLNNWCLFIDMAGITGFSCKDPESWGGRSNCIYLHVHHSLDYVICPLNGETKLLEHGCCYESPLWVYPSITNVEKVGSGKLNC